MSAEGAHSRPNRRNGEGTAESSTGDSGLSGSGMFTPPRASRVTWDGRVGTHHYTPQEEVPHHLLPRPEMFDDSCAPTSDEIRKYSTKQSSKLSGWAWKILAKCLGIKTHENDKPWLGTIVYIILLLTGFSYATSKGWYCVYDIKSGDTPSTVFTGSVDIVMAIFWVMSGIYAHSLSGNLFSNKRFRDGVRTHSKMLFGFSAIKVTIFLAAVAFGLDVYRNYDNISDENCGKVGVTPIICKFMFSSRVSFSVLSCIWNLLCASVLFSICRTHTIVLRRFIKELEKDGLLFELGWAKRREKQLVQDTDITTLPDGEYLWDDDIPSFPTNFQPGSPASMNTIPIDISNGGVSPSTHVINASPSYTPQDIINNYDSQRHIDMMLQEDPFLASSNSQRGIMRNISINSAGSDGNYSSVSLGADREAGMLSVNQILISWWKLQCRLHISSLALQRWIFCWIAFITIISVHYIIMWLKKEATVVEVFEFIIPILLLPLLCSGYAEVNYECSRVSRAIVPIAERLQLLRYMLAQPLQMTMFGSPVNYASIATVITAVGVAFATKIIFDEFSKVHPV